MHTRWFPSPKSCAFVAAGLVLALATSPGFAQQQDNFNPNFEQNFNANPNVMHPNSRNPEYPNSGNPLYPNTGNPGTENPNLSNQQHPADVPMTHYTGREHGSLGVTLSDNGRGDVWVSTVVPHSPADRAGVRPGDQILAFDNQPIHSYREAVHAINLKGPYDQMLVHVRRNGQDAALTASLLPHQAPGDPMNATAMQGQGPGYFQHPQRGTMHTYVAPMQGYASNGGAQPTFNNNAAQAGYNQQQGGNQQQNGNQNSAFQPFKIATPPLGFDPNQTKEGIRPTGPTF